MSKNVLSGFSWCIVFSIWTKRGNDCFKNWQLFAILPFLPTINKKKWITLKTKTPRRLTFFLGLFHWHREPINVHFSRNIFWIPLPVHYHLKPSFLFFSQKDSLIGVYRLQCVGKLHVCRVNSEQTKKCVFKFFDLICLRYDFAVSDKQRDIYKLFIL